MLAGGVPPCRGLTAAQGAGRRRRSAGPVSLRTSAMSASRRSRRVASMIFDSDAGATEPSGSRAGVATESAVAKTPGPEREP